MTDADTARANGWTVGTLLVGDEGHGPTTIEITAIGRTNVLAVTITGRGHEPHRPRESMWTLRCRDWQMTA